MQNFAQVIDAWPSIADFSADIGVKSNVPPVWKHRDSVPARYWPLLVAGAERRGIPNITLTLLAELASRKRAAAPAAQSNEGAAA